MKKFLTLSLCVIPILTLRAEIPELFLKDEFGSSDFALAVNHYVKLGRKRSQKELVSIACFADTGKTNDAEVDRSLRAGPPHYILDPAERVAWVCSVLFEVRPTKVLRSPQYGWAMLPVHTMPAKSWPLLPVAHSGRSYFVLDQGYGCFYTARYVEYCFSNGVFRKTPLPVPTREEAKADAVALWNSPAWKAIKWTDKGLNWEYTLDEKRDRIFIEQQCDCIGLEIKAPN